MGLGSIKLRGRYRIFMIEYMCIFWNAKTVCRTGDVTKIRKIMLHGSTTRYISISVQYWCCHENKRVWGDK